MTQSFWMNTIFDDFVTFTDDCIISMSVSREVERDLPWRISDGIHRQMIMKSVQERVKSDSDEDAKTFRDSWAVMCDKVYQGAGNTIHTLQLKKQPRGGSLMYLKAQFSARVYSDRVLVENFYDGCQCYGRSRSQHTGGERRCTTLHPTWSCLDKFHVSISPLRADDAENYNTVDARYQAMSEQRPRFFKVNGK